MNDVALVLAAGKGTRMHSDNPKVLQQLLGEPMLGYVYASLEAHFHERVFTVVGHRCEEIQARYPCAKTVLQAEQLGTGHAVATALDVLCDFDHVLVLNGDTPLVTEEILASFMTQASECDLAFATALLEDAGSYGRVVRKDGAVRAIVEAKEYDETVLGAPSGEINTGIYYCKRSVLDALISKIEKSEKSGEYYLTDLVALALEHGYHVKGIECGRDSRLLGVNSPLELTTMEELLRSQIVEELLHKGVLLHQPQLICVGPKAVIEPGAEITGPCEIYGQSHIARGARIAAYTVVRDSFVASGAEIRCFSHLEGAYVEKEALVGPYARLRTGAHLEQAAHVGNFVELKKTRLGEGSKANHLTYLGDAEIGPGTNIGAGTITCNYDGVHKHATKIGANAFIGSNTALVAPVSVGDGALIGAGSTITRNVPEDALAVARSKQRHLPRKILPAKS